MRRKTGWALIVLCSVSAFSQDEPRNKAVATANPSFDVRAAERFANLALACVHKEYPNKIAHNLNSDADVAPPRKLTPAFYGCYDWHSSVHGHWLLARLARTFPDAPFAAPAMAALSQSITPENIAQEVKYLNGEGRAAFERPYGLAWLMQLGEELREWNDPQAQEMSRTLKPLEDAAKARLMTWLPKLANPVRIGEHNQTAFSLGLMLDSARGSDEKEFAALLEKKARQFYLDDKACPLNYEPSGEDFLSPCLGEADLMRRIMLPTDFRIWLSAFLPTLRGGAGLWLKAVISPDPSDPKLAHLDGLNLSRAWMLEGIASGLPDGDPRIPVLRATAKAHREAGLAAVTGAHYEGGHWLGSFAVYLVTRRGTVGNLPLKTITKSELLRLRPAVEQDLRELLRQVYGDNPSSADVKREFEACVFTPLRLGSLGPAVLVQAEAGHGATGNAAMINIYVPERNGYRWLVKGAGFGPTIVPGEGSIPDLVFGWAMGVCQGRYSRYRYENREYVVDACNQDVREDARGTCEVKTCEKPAPQQTFASPWDEEPGSFAASGKYFPGPGRTGKEILSDKPSAK